MCVCGFCIKYCYKCSNIENIFGHIVMCFLCRFCEKIKVPNKICTNRYNRLRCAQNVRKKCIFRDIISGRAIVESSLYIDEKMTKCAKRFYRRWLISKVMSCPETWTKEQNISATYMCTWVWSQATSAFFQCVRVIFYFSFAFFCTFRSYCCCYFKWF